MKRKQGNLNILNAANGVWAIQEGLTIDLCGEAAMNLRRTLMVINGPCYKNELSIYERETLDKIEGFRRARAHWLASADESQKTFTNVKEGMGDSKIYNGRCKCLRKIRLKTTLLREHYKSLRPARYWTFKRKLTEYDIYEDEIAQEAVKREPKPELFDETCSPGQVWTKKLVDECEREVAKLRGRRARRRMMKECKEKKKASGPCRMAIKRLKAAKIREGLIESCKCEDGREVTVVIKGICLCDKTSLNKIDLHKVCDEYSKMSKPPEVPYRRPINQTPVIFSKETKETDTPIPNQENAQNSDAETPNLKVSDSIEIYKKKLQSSKVVDGKTPRGEEIIEEPTMEQEDRKKLTFENEQHLKGDGGTRKFNTGSDLTLFRKFSSDELVMEDSDPKQKTIPGTSDPIQAFKKPVKQETMQQISKPVQLPPTESLNNLLVNEGSKTEAKEDKKRRVTMGKKPPVDDLAPSEAKPRPLVSDSLEIHKKKQAEKVKKGEEKPDKTSQIQPKADRNKNQDTENRTKVRLSEERKIIQQKAFPEETSTTPRSGAKPEAAERPDITIQNSWSGDTVDEVSETKLKAESTRTEAPEVKQTTDNASMVTLYKNRPEGKSEMGLTKEEYERMQEIEREEQNNQKKDAASALPPGNTLK